MCVCLLSLVFMKQLCLLLPAQGRGCVEAQPSPTILSPLGLVGVHVNKLQPDTRIQDRTIVIHSGYVIAACAALCILAVCSSYVSAAYATLCALAIMPSASPAAVGGACLQEQMK